MDILKRFVSIWFLALTILLWNCDNKTSIDRESVNKPPRGGMIEVVRYDNGELFVSGWAADEEDGAPVKKIEIFVDDELLGEAALGIERPDVVKHFNNSRWLKSGWRMKKKTPLKKGEHMVYAVVYDKVGSFKKPQSTFHVD